MSRVRIDTINNVTELLMKGHCFSSPVIQKDLNDVIGRICKELTEDCPAGGSNHVTEKAFGSHELSNDSLLLSLSVLTSVLSTANCSTVQNVQERVVEHSEIFNALVFLLGFPNQLVSYSACKALTCFLSSARAKDEKLEYIIKFSIHGNEAFKKDSKPETYFYHTLATFDLIRMLCKKTYFGKSAEPKAFTACTCVLKERTDIDPVEEGCFKNFQALGLLVAYLTTVFHKCFGSDQKKVTVRRQNFESEPNSGGNQEDKILYWFDMLDYGEKDILFISYLKMIKTLLKRDGVDTLSICKVATLFSDILKEGTISQRTCAKLIFDIMTNFLQRKEKNDMSRFQAESARNICSVFKTDAFWEKIPYHDGLLGFGGPEFTEKSVEQTGDFTLLRKLTKLNVVALKILLDSRADDQIEDLQLVITSFSTLSKYMSCKVRFDPTHISNRSESEWLCRLFADGDDDAMIFILFTVLQIYKCLTELLHQDSHLQKIDFSSNVRAMFCPHNLFWNYLKSFDFDHSLLLDLLISSETDFLPYFTAYLHCMKLEWEHCGAVFRELEVKGRDLNERYSDSDSGGEDQVCKRRKVDSGCAKSVDSFNRERQTVESNDIGLNQVVHCADYGSALVVDRLEVKEENATLGERLNKIKSNENGVNLGLDKVLSVMIRLRMSLERLQQKKMFPYTISPLIRLLVDIEDLYER